MSAYIISGEGFFKSITFNRDERKSVITWTKGVRKAQLMKGGAAERFIEKHQLNAFVWKPYHEHVGERRFVVRKVNEDYSFGSDSSDVVWKPYNMGKEKMSDIIYLNGARENKKEKFYSEEEAKVIAMKNNEKECDKLVGNIEKLMLTNERLLSDE